MADMVNVQKWLKTVKLEDLDRDDFWELKSRGFSDAQIASSVKAKMIDVRNRRKEIGVLPTYKRVDTCAAEFEADTPYMYSTYDGECESKSTNGRKVLILGGGPNRIGQGIEFDYCCCHASYSLRKVWCRCGYAQKSGGRGLRCGDVQKRGGGGASGVGMPRRGGAGPQVWGRPEERGGGASGVGTPRRGGAGPRVWGRPEERGGLRCGGTRRAGGLGCRDAQKREGGGLGCGGTGRREAWSVDMGRGDGQCLRWSLCGWWWSARSAWLPSVPRDASGMSLGGRAKRRRWHAPLGGENRGGGTGMPLRGGEKEGGSGMPPRGEGKGGGGAQSPTSALPFHILA
eukprot:49272-Chlamydomonas_euryale.AAC.5